MSKYSALTLVLVGAVAGCQDASTDPADAIGDTFLTGGKADGGIEEGSANALAVLRLINEATLEVLDDSTHVGLDARAAEGIHARRVGPDGEAGTGDDAPFETLAALDAVPYVGRIAFERLLEYALANGFEDEPEGGDAPTQAALDSGVLLLANTASRALLDDDVRLDVRAADGIYERRHGAQGLFGSLEELDAVPFVGARALERLEAYALANGYVYSEAPDPFGDHFCIGPHFDEDDGLAHLAPGETFSSTLPLFDYGARAHRRTCGPTGCGEWTPYAGAALYGVIYGHDTNRAAAWRRGVGFTPAELESGPIVRATRDGLSLEARRNRDERFSYPDSGGFAWNRAVSFHARAPYDGGSPNFEMNQFEEVSGDTTMRTSSDCFQIRNIRTNGFDGSQVMTVVYGLIESPETSDSE